MKRIFSVLIISILLLSAMMFTACLNNDEHVHTYEDVVVDPTCTDAGYTIHTCTDPECGYVMHDTIIAPSEDYHNFVHSETIDPTCTEDGYDVLVCEHCDEQMTDNPKKAKGHKMSAWTETKTPTCTEIGEEVRSCQNCDLTEARDVSSRHTYDMSNGVVTDPTCRDKGYTTYTCTLCGHTYDDKYVQTIPHEYSDWFVTALGDCENEREESRQCRLCGEYERRYLGYRHVSKMIYVSPTCAVDGYTAYECQLCGHIEIDSTISAHHEFGEWGFYKAPSCETEGLERRYCSGCDVFEERRVGPQHIADNTELVDPTKTNSGYTIYSCDCGYVMYRDDFVSAVGSAGLTYKLHTFKDAETGEMVTEYIVTGLGTCTDTEIVIPYMYEGIVVAGIDYRAFYDCDTITAVYIPHSVYKISSAVFWNCDNLVEFNFDGTIAQWNLLTDGNTFDFGLGEYKVNCYDGTK